MHPKVPAQEHSNQIEAELPHKLKIILAYENLSAALWAAETFTGLLRKSPEGADTQLLPWSFATLSNPADQAQATAAAAQADLIVIAPSSSFRLLPGFVESWLKKCLSVPRRTNTAVAALLRSAHRPEAPDSQRLRAVKRLAEEAGCRFFAPLAQEAV